MESLKNELKINRCRKCKNTTLFYTYDHVNCYTTFYGIECSSHPNDCTNSIRGFKTQEDAIVFWNKRNDI